MVATFSVCVGSPRKAIDCPSQRPGPIEPLRVGSSLPRHALTLGPGGWKPDCSRRIGGQRQPRGSNWRRFGARQKHAGAGLLESGIQVFGRRPLLSGCRQPWLQSLLHHLPQARGPGPVARTRTRSPCSAVLLGREMPHLFAPRSGNFVGFQSRHCGRSPAWARRATSVVSHSDAGSSKNCPQHFADRPFDGRKGGAGATDGTGAKSSLLSSTLELRPGRNHFRAIGPAKMNHQFHYGKSSNDLMLGRASAQRRPGPRQCQHLHRPGDRLRSQKSLSDCRSRFSASTRS